MTFSRLLILPATLVLIAATPALAQSNARGWPAYRGTPVDAEPTPYSNGGSCVKACDNDFTPCDPNYYKVADRRCNRNQMGSF